MPVPCDHLLQVHATYEDRGFQLLRCSVCGEVVQRWLGHAYSVPADPMDGIECEGCQ